MLYRQTDLEWKDDLMTSPEDFPNITKKESNKRWEIHSDGVQGDKIGRWGCLITAVSNAYCDCNKTTNMTPRRANELMRKYNGYKILRNKKKCKFGEESNIVWSVMKMVFKIKNINYHWYGEIDINHPKYYYICRVPYRPPQIITGHYNLIVSKKDGLLHHFDSDTGATRVDWKNSADYFMHRLEFE